MLSYLNENPPDPPISVQFLYTSKIPHDGLDSVLFLPRLKQIFASSASIGWSLCCYLTGISPSSNPLSTAEGIQSIYPRRINHEDLLQALGPVSERNGVVAYVCGPAAMTDEFLKVLRIQEGMEAKRVLYEKWWWCALIIHQDEGILGSLLHLEEVLIMRSTAGNEE